jgi:Leucine-rich repeat (LRR) protein
MSENQTQKELSSEEIRKLFLIVQNELINIKKKHEEDINKLKENVDSLKLELNQKDKEIKSLKKTIDKLSHNKHIESSKSMNLNKEKEKDVKPIFQYTEEEINYMNEFNQKYNTNINGNEKILDLSNDNDNNTINKPNKKLGNEELLYFTKFRFGRLQQLYLGKNNISDISPLALMKFEHLEKLSLANNTIIDISPLEKFNCFGLKELYLYNNYISDITILAKVKFNYLEKLSLFSNEIKDISILDKTNFPKLQVIRLDNNQISDIRVFCRVNFKNLKKLSLFNNKIPDFNGIENMNISTLKEIWLNGNNIDMAITSNEKIYDKIRDKNIKIIV